MHLSKLLYHYMGWVDRFIPPRARDVGTWSGFWQTGKAVRHMEVILELAQKIKNGKKLNRYLSDRVATKGYMRPSLDKIGKIKGIQWGSKDYALNLYEVHHLHLDPKIGARGWSKRTNDLLFVVFGRDAAVLIMVGNHKSFDDGSLADAITRYRAETGRYELKGVLPPARDDELSFSQQNSIQRRGISTIYNVDGKTIIGASQSTAGTSMHHTRHAADIKRVLNKEDSKIDDPNYTKTLFQYYGLQPPENPTYEWKMSFGDLLLFEKSSGSTFNFAQWRR